MTTDPGLDPALLEFLTTAGIDPNALLATSAPAPQLTLAEALMGSAMAVSGRMGLTGSPYSGVLPSWAQGLSASITTNDDFDPYLGIVSQQGDERVYWGADQQETTTVTRTGNKFSTEMGMPAPESEVSTSTTPGDGTTTVVQAMNMPYTWDEDEIADAIKRMKAAGLQVDSFDSLVSAWGSLVNRAAMTYSLSEGERKVTPWDVLDMYKNEAVAAGTWVDPNRTETTVHRNVTEITEGEAFASLQSTLSQMLGRDPSDQEVRDFLYRGNQLAASNPSISRTVTQYKNGDAVSSSTHTDPGYTAADMAMDAYGGAQNDPDYAEYRSGSYYFNALMSALGPIGG